MSGIVGYIGQRDASEVLMQGLRRLEYRGCDSPGIAVPRNGSDKVRRCEVKRYNRARMMAVVPLR